MSEARAITNLIGNGVATVIVAKSEKEFHPDGKLGFDAEIADEDALAIPGAATKPV
ncbi:C4-dicarboxylate transport protein [compost metagenome]